MTVDLAPKQLSLKTILMRGKFYILGFFSIIFVIAFAMAGLHPQQQSFAKEYNYLYSLKAAMEKGRDVNFDHLEAKLKKFELLRPEFDSLMTDKYIADQNFEKVGSILNDVQKRLKIKDAAVDGFTRASLSLEQKEIEEAYKISLELVSNAKCKSNQPLVYVYNLYRMVILEEMLGYELSSKEPLRKFLKEAEGTAFLEDGVIKKISDSLNNS